jgi:periplasmic divalent cation tolerance protein
MTAPDEALIAVHTTVASHDDARRLAREAITARLAACVQLEPIESHYIWKGALVEEPEIRITFKTTGRRRQALMAWLRREHPYEIPAISSQSLQDPDPAYLRWVGEQTQPLTPAKHTEPGDDSSPTSPPCR